MPMLTTLRIRLPVWPLHAPSRTARERGHLASTAWTSATTSWPSTTDRSLAGARSAMCSTARSSVALMRSPANIASGAPDAGLRRELDEQLHRLVRHPVLRIVEEQPAALGVMRSPRRDPRRTGRAGDVALLTAWCSSERLPRGGLVDGRARVGRGGHGTMQRTSGDRRPTGRRQRRQLAAGRCRTRRRGARATRAARAHRIHGNGPQVGHRPLDRREAPAMRPAVGRGPRQSAGSSSSARSRSAADPGADEVGRAQGTRRRTSAAATPPAPTMPQHQTCFTPSARTAYSSAALAP